MTPTISPTAGTIPQSTASSCSSPAPAPYAAGAAPAVAAPQAVVAQPAAVAAANGGGAVQAVNGVAAVQGVQGAQAQAQVQPQPQVSAGGQVIPGTNATPEQLIPILQNLINVINELIPLLQQQQAAAGTGAATTGGGGGAHCAMPNCPMNDAAQGAMGAPTAAGAEQASTGAAQQRSGGTSGGDGGASGAAPAAGPAGNVDPSTVKDKTGTGGMNAAALRGLEEAHRFGLPLVSGKRSGSGKSDHDHGNAIDVSTIAIGSPSSTAHTPDMKAFAEHMRQQGKAGNLNVKYVISEGRIASATGGWEWRDYTYPGKTAGEIAALKESNRGEYNRIQHFDHVHVSFK